MERTWPLWRRRQRATRALNLELVVLAASALASDDERSDVTSDDLARAVGDVIPSRDTRMLDYMEMLAVFESSLPSNAAAPICQHGDPRGAGCARLPPEYSLGDASSDRRRIVGTPCRQHRCRGWCACIHSLEPSTSSRQLHARPVTGWTPEGGFGLLCLDCSATLPTTVRRVTGPVSVAETVPWGPMRAPSGASCGRQNTGRI